MNPLKPQKSEVRLVEVTSAHANQRLDNFLLRQLGDVPRTRVYRIIRKGEVRVNKKRCKPEYKLQIGDQVRIPPLRREPSKAAADAGPPAAQLRRLEQAILFENDQLLVLDKPAGIAVHGGSGVAWGVIDAMRRLRPDADVELVHRLDRDTSGCLLLAKRRDALLALQRHLKGNELGKTYRAVVRGSWPGQLREIDAPLKRYYLANGERRVRVDASGKAALTRVECLQRGALYSQLRVELVTGRTHQIRVHCQSAGCPIAGDEKYGDEAFNRDLRRRGIRRLMLHAASLELPGCEFTPELVINAPLPPEFDLLSGSARKQNAAQN